MFPSASQFEPEALAAWSSGLILAQGARGPGFNSRSSPVEVILLVHKEDVQETTSSPNHADTHIELLELMIQRIRSRDGGLLLRRKY